MFVLRNRVGGAIIAGVLVSLSLAVPSSASATVGPLAAAPTSSYNATPDCPVSATDIVCAWNVPTDSSNPFGVGDYGECPYWAAEKYPTMVTDDPSSDPEATDWNGNTWIEHAQAEGLAISTTPASGDLAVWQATGGDISGHVAYVEAVDGSAIIVSQMDGESSAPFPAMQGSTEYISAVNLLYYEQTYDLEFVSTGDPSSTPLSYVEQPSLSLASVASAVSAAVSPAVSATAVTPAASPAPGTPAATHTPAAKRAKTTPKKRRKTPTKHRKRVTPSRRTTHKKHRAHSAR